MISKIPKVLYKNKIGEVLDEIFGDATLYNSRIYNNRNPKQTIITIANNVNIGNISRSSFSHLTHPQFQELLKHYHSENGIPIKISVFDLTKVSLPSQNGYMS